MDIAVAIVRRGDAVLLQQREREPFKGRWELPGGKVEPGEAPEQAVRREVVEELGVRVVSALPFAVHEHRYPEGPWVRLHAFEVALAGPLPDALQRRWVPLAQASALDVLEGTLALLGRLR
jgi:mutator protein MutT